MSDSKICTLIKNKVQNKSGHPFQYLLRRFFYQCLLELIKKLQMCTVFLSTLPYKLLPDAPPPPGYMRPKTLALDLKGTLVHTRNALGIGYEVIKDLFLED